jgi:hypothetical protein
VEHIREPLDKKDKGRTNGGIFYNHYKLNSLIKAKSGAHSANKGAQLQKFKRIREHLDKKDRRRTNGGIFYNQ